MVIFLRERLFEFELDAYRPLGDPTRFLGALAGHFSRCKDEDISPATYLACADRLVGDAERLLRLAARPGAGSDERSAGGVGGGGWPPGSSSWPGPTPATRRCSARPGCIDFGDQVSLALRLLRESPVARHELQRRYRYILVDEFQDTNRAQAELVAMLAERPPQRDRRRRRRPVDLPLPRRGDQQHPRVPRSATAGRGSSSCAATTGPAPRSWPPATA